MTYRLKRVHLNVYALLFLVLYGVTGCVPENVLSPTPSLNAPLAPTETVPISPSPTLTVTAIAPTTTPIIVTKTAVPTPTPMPTTETTDKEPLLVINPEQPGLNSISVGQSFILQTSSLEWRLSEYDASKLLLLSAKDAESFGDIYGWQFEGTAVGDALIVFQNKTSICESDLCPPEALIQMTTVIHITP